MADGAQAGDDAFELAVAHHQRIAARQQDVANFRVAADIVDAHRNGLFADRAGLPDHSFARAETAVHRAAVRDQQKNPIGIAVRQPRNRAVLLLMQRIFGRAIVQQFVDGRHRLHPDGIPFLLDQIVVIPRNPHRIRFADRIDLFGIPSEVVGKFFTLRNAVAQINCPLLHLFHV